MLRYLAHGQRRFGLFPLPIHERINWEFYASLKGSIGSTTKDTVRPPLFSHSLWIFPPEVAHGWVGDGRKPATVVSLHFGMVPRPLTLLVRKKGHLRIALTEELAQEVQKIVEELTPHYLRPNAFSLLYYEKALIELTLIALADEQIDSPAQTAGHGAIKVEAALAWYAEHLQEQPKIGRMASIVGVSQSHLRRLFWKWQKQSPHQAFIEVKMKHALRLMSQSNLKLDAVAVASGFTSAIDFCRAFKSHFGVSPAVWRKTQLVAYDEKRQRQELKKASFDTGIFITPTETRKVSTAGLKEDGN